VEGFQETCSGFSPGLPRSIREFNEHPSCEHRLFEGLGQIANGVPISNATDREALRNHMRVECSQLSYTPLGANRRCSVSSLNVPLFNTHVPACASAFQFIRNESERLKGKDGCRIKVVRAHALLSENTLPGVHIYSTYRNHGGATHPATYQYHIRFELFTMRFSILTTTNPNP
jgi:hypothetical protein